MPLQESADAADDEEHTAPPRDIPTARRLIREAVDALERGDRSTHDHLLRQAEVVGIAAIAVELQQLNHSAGSTTPAGRMAARLFQPESLV